MNRRNREAASQARDQILRSKNRFWTPGDFTMPESTTLHILGDLTRRNELRRVKRGLYWRGITSPLGMAPPSPEQIVHELSPGPGVGPSGLYAANLLRLSTQIPRQAEYALPKRLPSAPHTIHFVSRAARTGRKTAGLSPLEVALLETLERWNSVVESSPAEATQRLRRMLNKGELRGERLARAARTEPAAVRARLKDLLEAASMDDLAKHIPDVDPRVRASHSELRAA